MHQMGGRHCYKSPKRSDETKKSVFLHSRPYNLTVTFESPHLLDERIHFRFSRQQPVDVILQVLGDMGIAQFVRSEEGIVVR